MSKELGKWDNLQIGHIHDELEQIERANSIVLAHYISGINQEEINTIRKNLGRRKVITIKR